MQFIPVRVYGLKKYISNIESLSGHINVSLEFSVNENNLSNVAPDEPLLLNETQSGCFDSSTVYL